MANNKLRLTCLNRKGHFEVGDEDGGDFDWNEWFRHVHDLNNTLSGPVKLEIWWPNNNNDETLVERLEESMMMLQDAHFYVKELVVSEYNGATTLPCSWAPLLQNLVHLKIKRCSELIVMPSCWGSLPQLESLVLIKLEKLESIQIGCSSSLFSSLKVVVFEDLPMLVGWAGTKEEELLTLPCLLELTIFNCRNLACVPQCPKVSLLELLQFNPNLEPIHLQGTPTLVKVAIDNMGWLTSLPIHAFEYLRSLKICDDEGEERFEDVTNVFRSCSTSLQKLEIRGCPKLWSYIMFNKFEHLVALKKFVLDNIENWPIEEEEWQYLHGLQSLKKLKFEGIVGLVTIPNWVQYLPKLTNLHIEWCPNLSSIPKWMPKLTSLEQLLISMCSPHLGEQCSEHPPGSDWPHIQHIPTIIVEVAEYLDFHQVLIIFDSFEEKNVRWNSFLFML